MARGDSIIRVSIIGDASKLVGAIGQANKSTGGLLASTARSIGGTLFALGAVREGFGFLQDSVKEADRLGDATTRLNIQLGDSARLVESAAGDFRKLGLSSQDVLELAANFADLGTAAGISDPVIAANADHVAALAAAISLLGDEDPASIVDQIGKAAAGSAKAAKALGVSLIDTKDPAAQLANILAQLEPKLTAATTGSGDLEQSQRALQASVEDLQGKLGGPLSDALLQVTQFLNDEIDAIPHAIAGYKALGGVFGELLSPLARLSDALAGILRQFEAIRAIAAANAGLGFGNPIQGNSGLNDRSVSEAQRRQNERNGLTTRQGGP